MKIILRITFALLFCVLLFCCINISAFAENGLFTIPNSVTVIEEEAFAGCAEITDVKIPAGVTSIADSAFSGCVNLKRVYYAGTEEQWKQITLGANNNPLVNATFIFLGYYPTNNTIMVGGKSYTAIYFGRVDISSWSNRANYRDFWRLENAYEDFRYSSLMGDNLPESDYPMPVESGQVYVIDYTTKTGGVFRELMRCDGNTWNDMINTHAIWADAPIRTEPRTINGKEYAATYYGQRDLSDMDEQYACRDFWRIENAYEDFRNCPLAGDNLPDSNYPMPIAAGQVFEIDYTLKSGGVVRELMRCDGNIWDGRLVTHAFTADYTIHSDIGDAFVVDSIIDTGTDINVICHISADYSADSNTLFALYYGEDGNCMYKHARSLADLKQGIIYGFSKATINQHAIPPVISLYIDQKASFTILSDIGDAFVVDSIIDTGTNIDVTCHIAEAYSADSNTVFTIRHGVDGNCMYQRWFSLADLKQGITCGFSKATINQHAIPHVISLYIDQKASFTILSDIGDAFVVDSIIDTGTNIDVKCHIAEYYSADSNTVFTVRYGVDGNCVYQRWFSLADLKQGITCGFSKATIDQYAIPSVISLYLE